MPPSHAHSCVRLAAALDRVDAALAEPGLDWLCGHANTGVWAAWLRWMLRLLAVEFVLAWGVPGQPSGAATDTRPGAVRPLSPAALDRKIDRLIKAAARLWDPDGQVSARPPRRRWRRLLQLVLRWLGFRHRRFRPAPAIIRRFTGAPLLAQCKP